MRFRIRNYGDRFYEKPDYEGIITEKVWTKEKRTELQSLKMKAVIENGEAVIKWFPFYKSQEEWHREGRNHQVTEKEKELILEREIEVEIYFIEFGAIEDLADFLSKDSMTIEKLDNGDYEIGIDTGYDY